MAKASDNKFPKVIIVEGSAPSNADSGDQKLYIDVADHKLKRKDSAGTVVTIEGGTGTIGGATGATDNAIIRADGTGGVTIQNSLATVDDSGTMNIPTGQTYNINNTPHTHAGSGANTADPFIIGQGTAADLSAKIQISGLTADPDVNGAAGAGTSEEYDTATTGLTWDVAPTTVDSNTTVKSHLYVADSNGATKYGLKAWAPAGAYDARAKIAIGSEGAVNSYELSLVVCDSGTPVTNGVALLYTFAASAASYAIQAFTVATSSFTQRGSTYTGYASPIYLRITRDGSNNNSFYYSENGLTWHFIVTQALTFTVAKIGFRLSSGSATSHYGIVDWLRTSV